MYGENGETLTDLVAARVGRGRPMTFDQFEAAAIDPESGTKPSRGVLWKVAQGKPIMVSAEIVQAIAAGLKVDPDRAKRAAALQYVGLTATDPWPHAHGPDVGVTVVHDPRLTGDDLPLTRAVVAEILEELEDPSNTA